MEEGGLHPSVRRIERLVTAMEGFLIALGAGFYCLPMLIAYGRDLKDDDWIALTNIFLGWTLAGWLIAMVKACASERRARGWWRGDDRTT